MNQSGGKSEAEVSRQLDMIRFVDDDGPELDVRVDSDTVWLTVADMAGLFGRDESVIRRHIRNVFSSRELQGPNYRQNLPVIGAGRPEPAFNLDVIISVGYRVKSPRGVLFRQWATKTLRQRLLSEYQRRKAVEAKRLQEIQSALHLATQAVAADQAGADEAKGILAVIERYARSWSLLLQFDEDRLPTAHARSLERIARLTPFQARQAIVRQKRALMEKGEASSLFGQERDEALDRIFGALEQTFEGASLYPTVEVRAANLLYFIIKDHPFVDGNKRIASLLFLYFLDKNGFLARTDGAPVVDDNALVALALLIAQSNPKDHDLMIRLVLGLLSVPSAAGTQVGG
jgi:prophage maintenance system killer protein